ncbi:MAG: TonB-dependent receptor domain-containing protein [Campylobacteraceae bacterium]
MGSKRNICLSVVLIASLCTFSSAKDEVKDNKTKKPDEVLLSTITVVANRNEVNSLLYPGSVGILEADQLKSESNIIDSITNIPGIDTGVDNGRQIGNYFTIRGFGYQSEDRVIITQDGVPRSASLYSNLISTFRTDSDILKRVEVVKGASSILYGSGAIGGVVGMQTKDAKDFLRDGESYGFMIGQRFESNHMSSTRGAAYGKFDQIPVDILLYGKRAEYGNMKYPDGGTTNYPKSINDEVIKTAFFKLGVDISEEQRLTFSVFDFKEDLETFWQTLYNNGNPFVIGELTQRDYVLDYKYNPYDISWLNLYAKIYKTKAEYDRGYTTATTNLRYSNEDERWGVQIKNIAKFDTGFIKHNLVTGIDYQNRKEDALYLLNGSLSNFGSMPNSYKDWGFYIQDVMSMGNLELTLGGRYDKFDRSIKKPGTTDYDDGKFSPRVALGYTLFDRLTLLAGYSQSFRGPTPHETSSTGALNINYYYLPNPDLKAETADEYEVGFAFVDHGILSDDDSFNIKFMYFNGKIKDMISIKSLPELGTPPVSNFYAQYQNVNEAKRSGYEIATNYFIGDFSFYGSYEHLSLKDKKTKENIKSFADKIRVQVGYDIMSNLNFAADINHWFKPNQNPKGITSGGVYYKYVDKPYTIANFKGKWTIKKSEIPFLHGTTINFGVNNIFDKKYINANSVASISRVGTGRNFYVDFEVKF